MSIFLHHKKVVCQYSNNYICQIYKWGQIYSTHKKNIYIYMPQGKISGVNEVHKWSELLETLIQLLTSIVVLNSLA